MTSLIDRADFFLQDGAAISAGDGDLLLQPVTLAMGAALTLAAVIARLFDLILLWM